MWSSGLKKSNFFALAVSVNLELSVISTAAFLRGKVFGIWNLISSGAFELDCFPSH